MICTNKNVVTMETINERIQIVIDYLNITPYEFSKKMGDKRPDTLYNLLKNNNTQPSAKTLNKIKDNFPEINYAWLLTGEGKMVSNDEVNSTINNQISKVKFKSFKEEENNLVPLYDDVSTFGGNVSADMHGTTNPTEYIDTGSWFGQTKITSAIRHYGDSMMEYPNGCILALKDINDFDNVVFGRNYVVETNEIRVTKRVQSGKNDDYITAYSTNTETYPDGRQIHEPFPIKKSKINKISLVIGRIVKEHSSGDVITI